MASVPAWLVFRREGHPRNSLKWIHTAVDTRENKQLARVDSQVCGPRLHLCLLESRTTELRGARALVHLMGDVERSAREDGFGVLSAEAKPYMVRFLKRRGFSATEPEKAVEADREFRQALQHQVGRGWSPRRVQESFRDESGLVYMTKRLDGS